MPNTTKPIRIATACLAAFASSQAAHAVVLEPSAGGNPLLHAIGWQTFDNAGEDNNSGIDDTTPDSNSTFDATPVGSFAAVPGGGVYLTGAIGADASILGRGGYGQSTNNGFLNGPTFGSSTVGSAPFGLNLVDVPLADGSPGARIGPQGDAGASSWKFRTDGNQEFGDFSITNESDYLFRLERVHFDARVGNFNSPLQMDLVYLASGDSNLVRADNGEEILDLRVITEKSFLETPSTENISASVAASLFPTTAVRLAPGDSASFRFRWSFSLTDFAESQIDNLAVSGTFGFLDDGAFVPIDPASVSAGGGILGDTNNDGAVNTLDIDPFVLALTDPNAYAAGFPGVDLLAVADIDDDGVVNTLDIDPFVALLTAGAGRAAPEPTAAAFLIAAVGALATPRSVEKKI